MPARRGAMSSSSMLPSASCFFGVLVWPPFIQCCFFRRHLSRRCHVPLPSSKRCQGWRKSALTRFASVCGATAVCPTEAWGLTRPWRVCLGAKTPKNCQAERMCRFATMASGASGLLWKLLPEPHFGSSYVSHTLDTPVHCDERPGCCLRQRVTSPTWCQLGWELLHL